MLYISGHTDTDLVGEGVLRDGDLLLEKPFKPEVLLLKVHEALYRGNWLRKQKAG